MAHGDARLALLFPGQGSQFVGMGADLRAAFPEAAATFAEADDTLGWGLSRLCAEGPEEVLNDTANTQPAIYTTTMALWRALQARAGDRLSAVALVAGHSLGEFSALTAAGVLSFAEGLRLVRCRGEAMRDAGAEAPGGMAAIVGLDDEAVAEVVAEVNGAEPPVLWIANYNSPGQVVIAGRAEALERAQAVATGRGAKRYVPLAVSVACHTPLMAGAAAQLAAALDEVALSAPWAPVVSNASAVALQEPTAIREALICQLTSPVRWVESVQVMVAAGATEMLEVGARSVVAALVKRVDRAINATTVVDAATLASFVEANAS